LSPRGLWDPALAALSSALDEGDARARFGSLVEAGDRVAEVVACARLRARYEAGRRCSVTFRLRVASEGGEGETIGVVEVVPGGASYRLFHDDPALPTLPAALDGGGVWSRLRAGRSEAGSAVADPYPVSYHPGRSCVLRYGFGSSAGAGAVFGKVLPHRSAALWATLGALVGARRRDARLPRVAPPLAHLADLDMVVQSATAATDLGRVVGGAGGVEHMRRAGAALGALHGSGLTAPALRAGDLDELAAARAEVRALAPELFDAYDEAVMAAGSAAARLAPEPPVPSHGSLRTDQVLASDDGPVLVDLDGFCLAHPARDPANLLAYLDWRAVRGVAPPAVVATAGRAFLDGYAAARPLPGADALAVHRATAQLKIAARRFTTLAVHEWPLVPGLVERARALLGLRPRS
jgi:hypothetical protein